MSARLAHVYKHGVKVYHNPLNSVCSILVHPKNPTPQDNKIVCSDCDLTHVGKTARSYSTRVKEYNNTTRKSLTAVGEYLLSTGYPINTKGCSIIATESDRLRRKSKLEATYVYQQAPPLNMDSDYELPPPYYDLLSRSSIKRDITCKKTL